MKGGDKALECEADPQRLRPVARHFSGRIDYRHDRLGETGREWFSVTVLAGGDRTVRAHCEMDDERLLRDVVYTVDLGWKPQDAYVRLSRDARFVGAGAFRFGDRHVEFDGETSAGGQLRQRVAVPHRPPVFAPHPIVCDGWQAAAFDHARPERIQPLRSCANSSALAHGGSGPMIGLVDKRLEYVGETQTSVPAGAWSTRHYRVLFDHRDWPPLELFVTPEDRQLVCLRWDLLESSYELAELQGEIH